MLDVHPSPDSRVATVLQRWQQFLQQLEERFQSVLAEVEEASSMLLVQDEDEPGAVAAAWSQAHGQAVDLAICMADAWTDQFEPRLRSYGAASNVLSSARTQLAIVHDRMEVELEQTRLRVFAETSRIRWVRALRDAPSQLGCSCCGARQPIPATFGPTEVACPSCGARIDYCPTERVLALAGSCVHALCEEAAWEAWLAMRRAEHGLHAAPYETLELLRAYEQAQIAYWHAYLQTRVALLPYTAASFSDDLRNQLQPWYQQVEHRPAWARAGCPRTLV